MVWENWKIGGLGRVLFSKDTTLIELSGKAKEGKHQHTNGGCFTAAKLIQISYLRQHLRQGIKCRIKITRALALIRAFLITRSEESGKATCRRTSPNKMNKTTQTRRTCESELSSPSRNTQQQSLKPSCHSLGLKAPESSTCLGICAQAP